MVVPNDAGVEVGVPKVLELARGDVDPAAPAPLGFRPRLEPVTEPRGLPREAGVGVLGAVAEVLGAFELFGLTENMLWPLYGGL